MAVDVPDSFIARNKTPPRYPPPPRPPAQVIYTPNGSQKQPLLSSSSTTSSLKSGSSSIGNGGVSLDLQPPPFNSAHVNNNHAIINTNLHQNNNHHMKNSSSFDSCNDFNKKSSSKCPSSLGSVCESIGFDSMSYRTKSRGSLSTRSSSSGGEIGPPEYDLGPHREMAVDVPDNFVGVTKMPPRYPKTTPTNPLQKSKESLTSTNSTSTTTEKDAIITSTTNSQTNNHITTPHTPNRNSEVFFFFCWFSFDFFLLFSFFLWFFKKYFGLSFHFVFKYFLSVSFEFSGDFMFTFDTTNHTKCVSISCAWRVCFFFHKKSFVVSIEIHFHHWHLNGKSFDVTSVPMH